ncbi:MAG TPA: hypothetical protein VM146_04930 [Steroidobacteraceae bacterium]|nr:hypothetical protein [Steroidobacteraceae bacterium]
MSSWFRALLASLLLAVCSGAPAAEPLQACDREKIAAHARLEFEIYGPLSAEVEYFGFIFYDGERFRSAVVRSRKCHGGNCVVHVDEAGKRIPRGARVLGEWHTHPHDGAPQLSEHDVRGAHRNHHVRCYIAFYSNPDGEIFAWSPAETSVPTAMFSRASVGIYGNEIASLLRICWASAAEQNPQVTQAVVTATSEL